MKEVFVRSEHNPLITANDLPYPANAVFNAGAADMGDEILLLLRIESTSGRSHLTVARSKDGATNWKIEERALLHPSQGFPYETYGVEDCRITWMEDLGLWGLAYTAYSGYGPAVGLASTRDMRQVERIGVVLPPDDKNAALFPRKINGLYKMLHRPAVGGGSIWISSSPDLVYWGHPQLVLPVRSGPWWDGLRVGAGPQPIETEEGWLLIYHGVKEVAGGPIYRLGAALLDLDEPSQVIGRARRWLLGPQEFYERTGDAPNVIFTCGAVIRGDEVLCYYGASDSSVCLAKAGLSDILSVVKEEAVDQDGQ